LVAKLILCTIIGAVGYALINSIPHKESSTAQSPKSLGPEYSVPADYITNVEQNDSAINFTAVQAGGSIYRVSLVVPYEPDYDIDLDFYVDCSNGRIARAKDMQPATNRLEVAYYKYTIKHTCEK
jgi:hypothetical protein